jgi:hypothetical protein
MQKSETRAKSGRDPSRVIRQHYAMAVIPQINSLMCCLPTCQPFLFDVAAMKIEESAETAQKVLAT